MIRFVRARPGLALAAAVLAGALLVGLVWGATALAVGARDRVGASRDDGREPGSPPHSASPGATADPSSTTPPPTPAGAGCGTPTTTVDSANALRGALDAARPGDTIELRAGRYAGEFTVARSGTSSSPISLCGPADAVLDGGRVDKGYVLHLDHVAYVRVAGFTVTNGQKGVMADATTHSVIQGLRVSHIGDEAIHLRNFSSDNQVLGNTVGDTGLRKPKYGEGIYIGTANSNWNDVSGGRVDTSDRNLIQGNTISRTTAESVDIKEGTSDGVLKDNRFDGSAMKEADSWVDVKGNGWLIQGNAGVSSPTDGYQTHTVYRGWGTDNRFVDNSAQLNGGDGVGFHLAPVLGNVVACSNTASGAREGLSNVTCSSG